MYLRALQHAVVIVELPASLSAAYRQKCDTLTKQRIRAPLSDHPHSLELHFPSILRDMSASGRGSVRVSSANTNNASDGFDPLWHQPPTTASSSASDSGMAPLFYYVAALPYHVVYCTAKKNNKEDWTGRDAYWTQVADQLTATATDTATTTAAGTATATTAIAAAFRRNMGANFILPASHPQLGPSKIHPRSLSYLHRTSFLRTDLDVAGSPPKDVVVPYFLPDESTHTAAAAAAFSCTISNSSSSYSGRDRTLLFFAGSDNPRDGYRSLFLRQLQRAVNDNGDSNGTSADSNRGRGRDPLVVHRDGIVFALTPLGRTSTSWWPTATAASNHHHRPVSRDRGNSGDDGDARGEDGSAWYDRQMRTAKFCLVLRGDTTSSKRFFSAVAAGCLPVVVSDGLRLPFAASGMVDYSAFALFFPESVAMTPKGLRRMLDALRALPPSTYSHMRCALHEARRYLLYKDRVSSSPQRPAGGAVNPTPPTQRSLFNPVTLTLIELLMHRERYCRSAAASFDQDTGSMCHNLLSRLEKVQYIVAQ